MTENLPWQLSRLLGTYNLNVYILSFVGIPTYLPTRVNRLGDLLDFGQLFKASGNN